MSVDKICNELIDYSTIAGERILPYSVALNMESSILYPQEGEFQTFCYDITAKGENEQQFVNLQYFLLGICGSIAKEDILDVTVVINGEKQEIIWGENVDINTVNNPDVLTGCTGIKFDFPLDKQIGLMQVCVVLNEPYKIGPVNVCMYGENTIATGLEICGPACRGASSCESVFYQKETVCVPVRVTPYAKAGTAKASCCGRPSVKAGAQCTGKQTACTFTVTQNLCIEIPIAFGADIETGTAAVECGNVSEDGCDCS